MFLSPFPLTDAQQVLVNRLDTVSITYVSRCAREAGLRWRNDDRTMNKAGILTKLCENPTKLRLAVSVLERLQGTGPAANPFDDILRETPEEAPEAVSPSILSGLLESLHTLQNAVHGVSDTLAGQTTELAGLLGNVIKLAEKTERTFSAQTARIAALEQRAPVQFIIDHQPLPVITGQHHKFPELCAWLTMGKHIMLIGGAGTGKTTAAVNFAKLIGRKLESQPLSLSSTDVLGFVGPSGNRVETAFTRAWEHGLVFLWDEICMSTPDAVGALNAALANGFCALPGVGVVKMHENFRCIAGDNSDTGASALFARNLLDGATLDRFERLQWDIDAGIEASMAGPYRGWLACVRAIRAEIARRPVEHVGATPRAVKSGAEALASSFYRDGLLTREKILHATCRKGALIAEWTYIERLPAVQSFLSGSL